MKRSLLLLVVLLSSVSVFAETTSRYIVATRRPAEGAKARLLDGRDPAERGIRAFESVEAFAANLTPSEVAALRRDADVRFVEPVVPRHASEAASVAQTPQTHLSPYSQRQVVPYGIDMIGARTVWNVTRGGGQVNVVVMDTGTDYRHPDLAAAFAGGYDTFSKKEDPADDNSHGTHVAGTIAAADNTYGVVGVAPQVRLWAVKVLDKTGNGDSEHLIAGLDWVLAKKKSIGGRWIINLSLGAQQGSTTEEEAFARVANDGVLVIAASGNRAFPAIDYPAAYPTVMAIGAIDSSQRHANFSNTGGKLSVVGPGVGVLSTVPMGTTVIADVQTFDDDIVRAFPVRGTPKTEISGKLVYCNLGRVGDYPPAVVGNIALIRRGEIYFNEKVKNAKAAGAKAVVLFNRVDGPADHHNWTLILQDCTAAGCNDNKDDLAFDWPLTLAVDYQTGETLLAKQDDAIVSYRDDDYALYNGTSMATPHVTGAAALAWSVAPDATAAQIRSAIETTAKDIGSTGFDPETGHGVVDVFNAAKALAPSKFGLPSIPPPPPPPQRRRSVN